MDKATVIFATRWDASEFEADVLMPAIREGRITRQEAEQVEAVDSIVRCEDQQGNVVCAVIEISVTVQDDDRSRAAERARHIQPSNRHDNDALRGGTGPGRSRTRQPGRAVFAVQAIRSSTRRV